MQFTLSDLCLLPEVELHAVDDLHHLRTHLLSDLQLQFIFFLSLTQDLSF